MNIKEYLLELKKYSPYDFSEYSDNSIQRRLQKVMETHQMTIEQLHEKTISDSNFVEQLVNDITVNTTEFFRDPEVWLEYYEQLQSFLKPRKQIRIWHAGSSTGQEVYSNLILLNHFQLIQKATVFATDINKIVLNDAAKGTYRASTNLKSIDAFQQLLASQYTNDKPIDFKRYISVDNPADLFRIDLSLKKNVTFQKHDLVRDINPFEEKFDIIFCRNVLIYFNTALQNRILKMFHDSLCAGGMLILGNHESLLGFFKTRFQKNGNLYIKNNAFHFKY
jgi:chemotaxis protein methyltransferase CheR